MRNPTLRTKSQIKTKWTIHWFLFMFVISRIVLSIWSTYARCLFLLLHRRSLYWEISSDCIQTSNSAYCLLQFKKIWNANIVNWFNKCEILVYEFCINETFIFYKPKTRISKIAQIIITRTNLEWLNFIVYRIAHNITNWCHWPRKISGGSWNPIGQRLVPATNDSNSYWILEFQNGRHEDKFWNSSFNLDLKSNLNHWSRTLNVVRSA